MDSKVLQRAAKELADLITAPSLFVDPLEAMKAVNTILNEVASLSQPEKMFELQDKAFEIVYELQKRNRGEQIKNIIIEAISQLRRTCPCATELYEIDKALDMH